MQRLAELRKRAGLTQTELAERLSISQVAISQWESGLHYPRSDKIPALADALGCTIDELFRDK